VASPYPPWDRAAREIHSSHAQVCLLESVCQADATNDVGCTQVGLLTMSRLMEDPFNEKHVDGVRVSRWARSLPLHAWSEAARATRIFQGPTGLAAEWPFAVQMAR
jgi:hypothetical protein